MGTTLEYLIRLKDQLSPAISSAARTAENSGIKIKRVVDSVHSGSKVMSSSLNELRFRLKAVNEVRFGTVLVNEFRQATREAKALERQIASLEGTNRRAGNSFALPSWAKAAVIAGGLLAVGKAGVSAAVEKERVSKALNFTTGGLGKDAMQSISDTSNRLGLDKMAGFEGFKTVSASVRSLNFDLNKQLEIYNGVSEAAATFNLTSHETKLAYLALGQMASKGVVSSEELRRQLGEKIPGALGIAARAMGVTERKLNDMLRKGEIMAKDFLPRFAKQLHKEFGQSAIDAANGAQAALNRYNNAIFDTKVMIGERLLPAVTALWNRTAEYLNLTKSGSTVLREEQGSISGSLQLITKLNEGNALRKMLLQDLVKEYPKLFGSLDIEKVKNSELLIKLNEVNDAYEKRVKLATNDEVINKAQKSYNLWKEQYILNSKLAQLADRKDAAGKAAYENLYPWGQDFAASAFVINENKPGRSKKVTKGDFFQKLADNDLKRMQEYESQMGIERNSKSSNQFKFTVEEAFKLANNPDALAQKFGKNSQGKNAFLSLAKQISRKGNTYNTDGGGMAWMEKLAAAMNPSSLPAGLPGGTPVDLDIASKASEINNGGQRSIIINIDKQVETLEVHSVNVKEGIEEIANIVRQEMRRVVQSVNGLGNN